MARVVASLCPKIVNKWSESTLDVRRPTFNHDRHGSKWGNPFRIKEYPLSESLEKYKQKVRDDMVDQLAELDGQKIYCSCKAGGFRLGSMEIVLWPMFSSPLNFSWKNHFLSPPRISSVDYTAEWS